MSAQRLKEERLFALPSTEVGLTERQRRVLNAIPRDGITAREAGTLLGAPTGFATSHGLDVLRALKRRGLVVERRNPTRYELAHQRREPEPVDWKGFGMSP